MTRESMPEWGLGYSIEPLGRSLPCIYVQDQIPPEKTKEGKALPAGRNQTPHSPAS